MKGLFVTMFVLAILAFAAQNSQAQMTFSIGPKLGINLANATLDPDFPSGVDKTMLTAFMFGAAAEFGVNEMFAVQAEPMYAMKGFKVESGGQEAKFKVNYLEIPVLAKVKFGHGKAMPYIFAGPNLGINLTAEVEGGGLTVDVKDSTESIDFGLDFGAGVGIDISPTTVLAIDGRYSLGLSDIDKTSSGSIKNTGIQFLVSFLFKLGN